MSDHRHIHRLARVVSRLTVDGTEDRRRHDAAVRLVSGGDMAQHVQVNLKGKVGRQAIHIEKNVTFPYPFLTRMAQTQSETTLKDPHFLDGVEMQSKAFVVIGSQVVRWIENDSQFITGAVIRCHAWSPDALKLTAYAATVHLTFFGYAAPAEDDTEG